MKKRMLMLAAMLAVVAPANAEPKPPILANSAHHDVKDAKKDLKDAKKSDASAADIEAAKAKLKLEREALKTTRLDRLKAARTTMRDKWKDVLGKTDAKAELKIHARRMARLHRAKAVATSLGKTDLVTKIDAILTRENDRFEKKLTELRGAK